MPTPITIPITPGLGLLLDGVSLVVNGNSIIREIMVLADPTNPTSLAGVTPAGALQVDGSGVTQPVSGTITANQGGAPWSVTFPSAQAVTGTFWQATQPVSGTITASQSTAANLNATIVFASPQHVIVDSASFTVSENLAQVNSVALGSPSAYGTGPGAVNVIGVNAFITNTPTVIASLPDTAGTPFTFTAAAQTATVALAGKSGCSITFSANASFVGNVLFETSQDNGSTWNATSSVNVSTLIPNVGTVGFTPVNGSSSIWTPQGTTNVRARVSAFTSGSIVCVLYATNNTPVTFGMYGSDGVIPRILNTTSAGNPLIGGVFSGADAIPNTRLVGLGSGSLLEMTATAPWLYNGTTWDRARSVGTGIQLVGLADGAGTTITLGAKTSANSIPVVLASDEATLPVSIAATVNVSVQNATLAVTQSTSPWVTNNTAVAGVTLGATAVTNFGTAPAAVAVPGVNSSLFIGTTAAVSTVPGVQEVQILGNDAVTLLDIRASSVAATTTNRSVIVQLNPIQPNLATPLNVADSAAEASLVQIQQELRQQSAFPNLSQVAAFQSSASATTLTLTFGSSSTLGAQLLLVAMSSTTTKPTFAQTGGTGTVVRGTDLKNSTTSPSVQIDLWRVTVAGTIIMTATFASGACAAIGYEISGLPLYGSLPNSQPFYDSLQISQGTASAATLNSFFTLLPGELPFLFVGLGSASTVSSSSPGTTRLTSFALDGTNTTQNVAASGNLQTFFAGRISGGPLEDMTNMTPAATFSGSSLFTCIYVSFKPVSMPIGGTVGSVLTQIAGNVVVSAAPGVQQVGIVGGTGVSLETTAGVLDLNLKNIGNNPVVTGTGVSGVGIPRVTVSSDSIPAIAATGATAPTSAEEIGFVDPQGKLAAVSATAPLPIQTDPQMLQVVTLLTRILACLESMKVMDGQAYGVYEPTDQYYDGVN